MTSYRTCFNTDAGRRVLGHILIEGGYFDADLDKEETAVRNFVTKILHNAGICKHPSSVNEFVGKIFELKSE